MGNGIILLLPVFFGFILTFVIGLSRFATTDSSYFYLGILLMALGWLMLVWSKWDQVRRGEVFTWGLSNEKMGFVYFWSYVLMVAGYLVSTFSATIERM